jgi:hypothetical protein
MVQLLGQSSHKADDGLDLGQVEPALRACAEMLEAGAAHVLVT